MEKKTLLDLKRKLNVNHRQKGSVTYAEQISFVLMGLQHIEKYQRNNSTGVFPTLKEVKIICQEQYEIFDIILSEEEYKLIVSDLYAIDLFSDTLYENIYEIFVDHAYKQKCGQFFTPDKVIKMVTDMVIEGNENIIMDTACGSGAFLIEAGKKVCNLQKTKLIGIEKDMVLANLTNKRIKKLYGETHYVICEDTLKIDQISFEPDIILANPPYGINIDGEPSEKVFIKKNIEMLKKEGVMAIIIPDGILGNDGNSELRKWILTQCRILAIIDLPKETFMPYTNIKTSIMIVKKGSFEKEYDIFMAISENCGHDARGNTVPGCDFEDIVTSYKKWIIKK